MTNDREDIDVQPPISLKVTPDTADAGGEIAITATPAEGWHFTNETILVLDHDGNEVARGAFGWDVVEGKMRCGPLTARAPSKTGIYEWKVVFAPEEMAEEDEAPEADPEPLATFPLAVGGHRLSVVAWDMPPAIEADGSFRVRVGIRCSSDCDSTGWQFVVHDQDGREAARGKVGAEPWAGTTGLRHAEAELRAPAETGTYEWTVAVIEPEADCPHTPTQTALRLNVVPAADSSLTVVAVDAVTGAPAEGLKVVVHPFRAVTDAQGVAVLQLPHGVHTVFVSGKNYFPFRATQELNGNATVRAELRIDREYSDADAWA